jgi:hypothetical protein
MRWKAEPGSDLARLRIDAHRVFDALWEFGQRSRSDAYEWLAARMNIPAGRCHFSMFDEDQCRLAIALCRMPERQFVWPAKPSPPPVADARGEIRLDVAIQLAPVLKWPVPRPVNWPESRQDVACDTPRQPDKPARKQESA